MVTLYGRDLQEVSASCFAVFRAAMWRAHAAHWVAACFVECISRDHKLFELLRLTFFCVCMLVSRSWKHLQVLGTKAIAGGWLSAVVMR